MSSNVETKAKRKLSKEEVIKSFPLYSNPGRIYGILEQLGFSSTDELDVDTLDQADPLLQYNRRQAIEEAVKKLNLGPSSRVVDVGSNVGSSSRLLTHLSGCHVTAIEIQAEPTEIARDLTKRCGFADKIKHIYGDFEELGLGEHDNLVAILSFCHSYHRQKFFEKCNKSLKPGGKMFIEDFATDYIGRSDDFVKKHENEWDFSAQPLPLTREQWQESLRYAGFSMEQYTDATEIAIAALDVRYKNLLKNREKHEKSHTKDVYDALEKFVSEEKAIFATGVTRLCRITAIKLS